jgi:hypothetical protein
MADENFGQNKKDAKEYYDTQRQIAKVIKQQTDTWATYMDAQKTVRENAREIRDTEKRINELLKEGSNEAKAEAAELQKQVDYTRQLNKELAKTSVLLKAGGKAIGKWGMEKLLKLGTDVLEKYNNMDSAARRMTIQMGMSSGRMEHFRNVSVKASHELALMGLSAEATGEMLGALNEESGRQLMLSQQTVESMAQMSQRLGMSHQEMAGLVGQMESFGMGTASSAKMIEGIADMSDRMGVNTGKVIKKVQQNIGLLNRLNFKGGVMGMAKLAAYAEKYKLSMEGAAGFAEKVMRPEGAIDAAANLQVLGGSLAKLGDPFQLMAQARNDPEAFAKNIVKATGSVAQLNKATGQFEVSAYQLDRLREVSETTGMSLEDLVGTAKQTAKMDAFGDSLKIKGDDKEFLSSLMDSDQMGAFVIDNKGTKQYLKNLSETQQQALANQLKADKDGSKTRATSMQTTQELIENNINALQTTLFAGMKEIDDKLRPSVEKFAKAIQDWAKSMEKFLKWIPYIIAGLAILQVVIPVLKTGFTILSVLAKGIGSLGKGLGGLLKGKGSVAESVGGGQGKVYKGGQFTPGGGRAPKGGTTVGGGQSGAAGQAGQAGKVGESTGKSATNMLKGAAAILILSAALFVFAKALQEFEKLQNGWQTLALAAVSLLVLSGALYIVGQIMSKASTNILLGSVAILALGVSLIPFAYAMSLLAGVGVGTMLGAALALGAFALAAFLMGAAIVPIIIGSVAIAILSLALMLFGTALQMVAPGMEMFLSSLSQLPALIGPLFMFGPALMLASVGIFALSVSLFALGAAWWFGGSAFKDLTHSLAALKGLDLSGMSSSIRAINHVDMAKIEAIRDLASMLSLVSLFGGIKIEFGEIDVKGTINLKGGSGVSRGTDWVNDPVFVSKLKNLIWESTGKGKKGGKS